MKTPRLAVIGAGGKQASSMLRALSSAMDLSEVVAIDRAWRPEARSEVEALGCQIETIDIIEGHQACADRCSGISLLANLAGPAYALNTRPLEMAVELGANYMDICDDADVTEDLLALSERARTAGTVALVGMGSSPGTTNVLCRLALDTLGDSARPHVKFVWAVDAHDQAAAAIGHVFHSLRTALGSDTTPSWCELEPEIVDFDHPVGSQVVVRMGHPEPLTLPRFTSVEEVIVKGAIIPNEFLHLCWALARQGDSGASDAELLDVYHRFESISLRTYRRRGSAMHLDIHVDGSGYRFASVSDMTMEHATGLPAATGVLILEDRVLDEPGVWPPETVPPQAFFERLRQVSPGGGGMHLLRLENGVPGERLRIRDLLRAGER